MAEPELGIGLSVKDRTGGKLKEAQKDILGLKSAATSAIPGFSLMSAGLATAGVVAVRTAWQLAETGAQVKQLSDSFNVLAQQAGESSTALLNSLKAASGGTIAESSLMLSANRAMMLGLGADAEKLGQLMEVARFRGRAMGLTTEQAFSDIVTGIGRMSPLILDNLGIVMDADKAYVAYAKSIGTTAEKLTDAQKKQVLLNQVIQTGQQQIQDAGGITDNAADSFQRLSASWQDLKDTYGMTLAPIAAGIADIMSEIVQATNRATEANKLYGDSLARFAWSSDKLTSSGPLPLIWNGGAAGTTGTTFTKTNAENEASIRSMAQRAKEGTGNFKDFAGAVKESQSSVTALTDAVALFKMVTGDLPATFSQLMTVVNAYGGYSNQLKEYLQWGFVGSTIQPEAEKWTGQQGAKTRMEGLLADNAQEAAKKLKDFGDAAKKTADDLRSSIKGLMTPTSVTRLDELETKFGVYKPKWDEPMRRVQDVIQQGEKSPWAKQYFGEATGEQLEMKALQFQRDWSMGLYSQLPLSEEDWKMMQQGLAQQQVTTTRGEGEQTALANIVATGLEKGMLPEDFTGKMTTAVIADMTQNIATITAAGQTYGSAFWTGAATTSPTIPPTVETPKPAAPLQAGAASGEKIKSQWNLGEATAPAAEPFPLGTNIETSMMPENFASKAIDNIKADLSENQEQIKELGKAWGDYFWPGASASVQFVNTFVEAAFPGILAKLRSYKYYSGGASEQ